MKVSLYDLSSDLKQIESVMDDETEKPTEFYDLLSSKTDSCVGYSKSIDDYIDAIDKRIEELKKFKQVASNKQERFMNYLLTCIQNSGQDEFKGVIYSVKKVKASESIVINDIDLIDQKFVKEKTTYTVDKLAIKQALKDGEEVEGISIIAKPRVKIGGVK